MELPPTSAPLLGLTASCPRDSMVSALYCRYTLLVEENCYQWGTVVRCVCFISHFKHCAATWNDRIIEHLLASQAGRWPTLWFYDAIPFALVSAAPSCLYSVQCYYWFPRNNALLQTHINRLLPKKLSSYWQVWKVTGDLYGRSDFCSAFLAVAKDVGASA